MSWFIHEVIDQERRNDFQWGWALASSLLKNTPKNKNKTKTNKNKEEKMKNVNEHEILATYEADTEVVKPVLTLNS